jgi:hypothetical protein
VIVSIRVVVQLRRRVEKAKFAEFRLLCGPIYAWCASVTLAEGTTTTRVFRGLIAEVEIVARFLKARTVGAEAS